MARSSVAEANDQQISLSQPEAPTSTNVGLTRIFPILEWAPRYQKTWLRPDLIAGLTVAALVVPKSLGYAGIAGVPLQYGLYAAAAGATLYALLGTSRQIATGPSSALAAVAAGAVVSAGSANGDALKMVASITLLSGIFFAAFAVFRMGWISQFLSKAVITGFLFGAGIQVAISELASITGTKEDGSNSWQQLGSWFSGLADTNGTTLVDSIVFGSQTTDVSYGRFPNGGSDWYFMTPASPQNLFWRFQLIGLVGSRSLEWRKLLRIERILPNEPVMPMMVGSTSLRRASARLRKLSWMLLS